ncbi:MAG TPA: hypothetical protein VMY77_10980 [Chitinophagaceae bacterium]|nr:hypothetical protein [Chitinophagaceae bacterium]
MKKNIPTPLADQYLDNLQDIKEAETDPFFYTRLKARMEKGISTSGWSFPLKPVWLVSMLVLFLFINTVFLVVQVNQSKQTNEQSTSLQNFASGYDLSVSTSF